MRKSHFHISSGASFDTIFASAEYWDSDQSINDFLDITYGIFGRDVKASREQSVKLLEACVERNKPMSIVVGDTGPLTLVWSVCTCDYVVTDN